MDSPKILLVDDRKENLVALEAILQRPDVDFYLASSGNEALGYLLKHEFALILMDVQMPGMDGFETAEVIRSRERTVHTPIIFVTAISTEQQYVFKGYEKGAVDYLSKPLDETILKCKVNVFLDLYNQKKHLEKVAAELRTTTEELQQANKRILENQRVLIEEERLKLLLQVSGATADEMNNPLDQILDGIEALKNHAASCHEQCRDAMEDLNRIGSAGTLLRGIVGRIQQIPAVGSIDSTGSNRTISEMDLTILSVDDDESYFALLSALMGQFPRIRLIHAVDCAQAEKILSAEHLPDLVLLDHFLPDGESFRVLSFLKRRKEEDIPVIVITGHGDEVIASRVIKAGATDYLPKTETLGKKLFECIQSAMEQYTMKKDVKKAMNMVTDMAIRDGLTGLYNRRYFIEVLEREISRDERCDGGLSLFLMDIDLFKNINDTYGHSAGDAVLREVGAMMVESMRGSDIVCRYGGEEFAVTFPNTSIARAYTICKRFNRTVESHRFSHNDSPIKVTISIGLTEYLVKASDSAAQLIERADRELYKAKEGGRNRVCATV
jgi:two-component system, cell cycle response regulator